MRLSPGAFAIKGCHEMIRLLVCSRVEQRLSSIRCPPGQRGRLGEVGSMSSQYSITFHWTCLCGRWVPLGRGHGRLIASSCNLYPLRDGYIFVFVALLFGFLLLIEGFCLDREEGSQGEIQNGEYHPDHQTHDAADQ